MIIIVVPIYLSSIFILRLASEFSHTSLSQHYDVFYLCSIWYLLQINNLIINTFYDSLFQIGSSVPLHLQLKLKVAPEVLTISSRIACLHIVLSERLSSSEVVRVGCVDHLSVVSVSSKHLFFLLGPSISKHFI